MRDRFDHVSRLVSVESAFIYVSPLPPVIPFFHMRITRLTISFRIAMGGCLMLSAASEVMGQSPSASNLVSSPERIEQLVQELASTDFRTRQAAVKTLTMAGDDAIEPLERAVGTASLDQRVLINSILQRLKQNSFVAQVARAQKTPNLDSVKHFPEWNRFATLVGKTEANIKAYLSLLQAEPRLFAAAMKKPADLPDLLESRAASLVKTTRTSPALVERFSVDSYVALLLLAGNKENRLPRATSSDISKMLSHSEFRTAVTGESNQWRLRIAGSYIQRDRIAVSAPLIFAREHKLHEGLFVARNVMTRALRGRNGLYAMMVIRDLGTEEDIVLLESAFMNRGVLFEAPLNQDKTRYTVYNGDLAMAVVLVMRNRDPRDFGFKTPDSPDAPFRFSLDTVGFHTNDARKAAIARYRAEFPEQESELERPDDEPSENAPPIPPRGAEPGR